MRISENTILPIDLKTVAMEIDAYESRTDVESEHIQKIKFPDVKYSIFESLAKGLHSGEYHTGELQEGSRIGNYQIEKRIGKGGMSIVYQASHVYIHNKRALKTLRPRNEHNMNSSRFLREAVCLAKLSHPNVVGIFDAGIERETPFIILEYVDGMSVHDLLEGEIKFFAVEQVLDMIEDLAEVLLRQEEIGIIHRDIKPGNIIKRGTGTSYCLIDYGLSGYIDSVRSHDQKFQSSKIRITKTGAIFGTPLYMSPEQQNGENLTIQSDIFSLGVTALECLYGREAYKKFGKKLLHNNHYVEKSHPRLPLEVKSIINNMICIDPNERYGSSKKLFQDIIDYRYNNLIPTAGLKSSAFIAMPFSNDLDDVYSCMQRACHSVKLRAMRVDRSINSESIWDIIVKEIERSMVVIADFSAVSNSAGINLNVVTEAAYARALKKPLCLISQQPPESLPFDWRQLPFIKYEMSKPGLIALQRKLCKAIRQLRV